MRGIILAGGSGTRLYPLTKDICKQLLPVNGKPMIHYPLSVLLKAGIKDILIISTPSDTPKFKELLGDGSSYGVHLSYAIQPSPDGLAQAFLIGEEFLDGDCATLILGDNIFHGEGLTEKIKEAILLAENGLGGTIFGYEVPHPERFGVIGFDNEGNVSSIEEKPAHPKSNYCVTGLYVYDTQVVTYAKTLTPSKRGELEITDLNQIYLNNNKLHVELLDESFTWFDTGTHESLQAANDFMQKLEE